MRQLLMAAMMVLGATLAHPARAQDISSGHVTINVMDYAGEPASHAWVVIRPISYWGGHIHQYASVDGAVSRNLPGGSYSAYAHHAGIGHGTTSFSVFPGQATNVTVWLNAAHYYGYYHWYRVHRVGVSHVARAAHQAHVKALAAGQPNVRTRRMTEHTAAPKTGIGNPGAPASGEPPTRRISPVDEPTNEGGIPVHRAGNAPTVNANSKEPARGPARVAPANGTTTIEPHVAPRAPVAHPPVHGGGDVAAN